MKKNIWILNHYAIVPNGKSGFRHNFIAKELTKRGYSVNIFFSAFEHITKTNFLNKGILYSSEIYDNVNYIAVKTYPYLLNNFKRIINMLSFVFNLLRIYKKFEKPDVIIASSVHPFTWIIGWFLAKRLKCKYIVEIRDLWPQSLIDLGAISKNSIAAWFFRLIEKFAYKRADSIISLLPYFSKYVEGYGISPAKVVYIPNGVDLEAFDSLKNSPTEDAQAIVNNHKGYFTFVYTGAMGNPDSIEVILETAKIIQNRGIYDIHFVLIGDGVRKKEFIKIASSLYLQNVFFYNYIAKDSIPFLLTHMDCNVVTLYDLPTYSYGISLNKIFDYLASAKPILFASNAANRIVKDANCGYWVPSCSAKDFVETVLKIYNLTPEARNKLGQNGRDYAEKYHSSIVLTDRLEEILQ